jgi:Na+-driven multidrug efflux pump
VRLRSQWDREITRLAVPAFGALIAEPLYVLSDTAIVGHLGTQQLAGLAVAAAILISGYSILQVLHER